MSRRALAKLVAIVATLAATAIGLSAAAFVASSANPANTIGSAADWTAPSVTGSTVASTASGAPIGAGGAVKQGGTYRVYANVTDSGNPASGVSSVGTSGTVATLTLNEGSSAADTSVGSFKVALASSSTGIRDTAGNPASFAAQAPADKASPEAVSINRHSASPSNAASVQFDVTFSESVTGVGTADFQVAASNVTGASVTGVSGSGSGYTVTVGTGSGDGSLGLNLVDDDSIADSGANKLGGTGTGNGG